MNSGNEIERPARLSAREHNRRVKRAIANLKAGGARVAIEICADGTTRVLEAIDNAGDDEAARVARLIEERMSDG